MKIAYMHLMTKDDPATTGIYANLALSSSGAVYVDASGELQVDVRLDMDGETVWLTQTRLATCSVSTFGTVNEHLVNIYRAGEPEREATIRKFRIVRQEGQRQVQRDIGHYNLDAVISVGYRVNSKTATAFRKWATQILKARLIDAHRRRQTTQARMEALSAVATHVLTDDEARALLIVIGRYSKSWLMLRQFDESQFPSPSALTTKHVKRLTEKHARAAISALKLDLVAKGEASDKNHSPMETSESAVSCSSTISTRTGF